MPDLSILLVVATFLATILLGIGGYRLYTAAKRVEPQALGAVVLAALHAAEAEVAAKQAEAQAAAIEAANAAAQLAHIKAQVASVPPAA
jgi:uncharacterized membrane protein